MRVLFPRYRIYLALALLSGKQRLAPAALLSDKIMTHNHSKAHHCKPSSGSMYILIYRWNSVKIGSTSLQKLSLSQNMVGLNSCGNGK